MENNENLENKKNEENENTINSDNKSNTENIDDHNETPIEPTTEVINNNNDNVTEDKIYTEDTPVDENISFNNETSTKPRSASNKFTLPNLVDSLPNQIIKEDTPKGKKIPKETTTDFDFCDMFDDAEKLLSDEINNLNREEEKLKSSHSKNVKFNDESIKLNSFTENASSILDPLSKKYNIPLKHNRIANIEDHTTYSKTIIRVFHKSESITESISNIENNNKFRNRFNKPKQLGLSSIRKHSTFIADNHFNINKDFMNPFDDVLIEETSSLNEMKSGIGPSKSNSSPNLSVENDLNEEKLKEFVKEKKMKKKATFLIDNDDMKEKEKKKSSFSSSLDLLLYKSHENLGYIDKIMLQKMNNTSKSRNVISSQEFDNCNNGYNDERYYYPIEFTDNVEGRKLYYEYKIRKNMSSEPLIIHRRNLLFVICFLLTMLLLGLLIYDYHSLLIKETNSKFFGWINAIYILHVVDMSIALLAYVYANESGKKLFTFFTIILGLFTIILFILRFIFTWATKDLIPIDYK